VLAGRPERFIRITEPGGTTLRELGNTSSSPSASITLTIRRDLQLAVMKAIYDAYVYAGGNWGGISTGAAAVVLDVNSGAILALVSYPTFNPTVFNPDTYRKTQR
jgi:penicillin-binding protein 2